MNNFLNPSYWNRFDISSYGLLNDYLSLIEKSISKTRSDYEYSECHHIVPVSFDESLRSDENNLVILSGRDHFEAHRLLSQFLNGEYKNKMTYAFHMMCYNKNADKYNVSAEDYELSRMQMSETFSGDNNPAKRPDVKVKIAKGGENRRGENNGNYGGLSYTNRINISISRKINGTAKGSNNPMYGKRGEDSPHYNKKHMHKDGIDRTFPIEEIPLRESEGWILGRPKKNKSNSSSTIESVAN